MASAHVDVSQHTEEPMSRRNDERAEGARGNAQLGHVHLRRLNGEPTQTLT